MIPTTAVVGGLTALAVWGHSTDWKLPKFSALIGSADSVQRDWCEEHAVPESQCVECNPALLPKGPDYGWCTEHGVHNCPLHHPDVAQLKETPTITPADMERAKRALELGDRPQNNTACKVYQRRVQFASVEAVQQAGLDVELVERRAVSEWIAGNGEVTYDQTRFANLSPRAAGTIWRVEKKVGDRVRAGEVMAILDSLVIGQAKSELVDALVQEELQRKTLQRLQALPEGAVAGRQVREAEAAFEKARVAVLKTQQTFANLGIPVDLEMLKGLSNEEQMARLRHLGLEDAVSPGQLATVATANLLPIRSPMDGLIVERRVVAGEVVDSAAILFQIADTSRMWLDLSIPLEEARKLSVGQPVRFRPDGSQQELTGTLNWISTTADQKTRMIKVRAELPNADGRLRNETFGAGRIILREEPEAIMVPNESVHWEGCCHVVFVRDKHYFDSPESFKVFHVRSVRLGAKEGGFTEIIAGVLPGEVVATKGSGVISAQLLKNNLGEGCTCVE
ncbi:MAG: efflux RND transporter periplasmic adaptor subunit [Pirellulales bacterium]|nr:efflux RND transporter periplasmic adaptor subunit [Pirellulales bacterium]